MAKFKICILTATRAEYGLLKPVILALRAEPVFTVKVVATGMHLSPEFGRTAREMEADGVLPDRKIPILLSDDTPAGISKTMGLALIGFADYFTQEKPDLLVVLGDRYETFAVCAAAANALIPIAHLYGGETTEGAVDEAYRHAITKMSCLHFTSTEHYRKRVIQLGEEPERVFAVGSAGVENARSLPLCSLAELSDRLSFPLEGEYGVVTFHPVTLEGGTAERQIKELLAAISCFPAMKFIFTKANADMDGRIINRIIDGYVSGRDNCLAVASLGMERYLGAVKYAAVVIGNSSSGIMEAPALGTPSVNIGDRQKGRIHPATVINCRPIRDEIIQAMKLALDAEFRGKTEGILNPYDGGNTSAKVASLIKEFFMEGKINLKKKFFDIDFKY